jgi:hypothetical protein
MTVALDVRKAADALKTPDPCRLARRVAAKARAAFVIAILSPSPPQRAGR